MSNTSYGYAIFYIDSDGWWLLPQVFVTPEYAQKFADKNGIKVHKIVALRDPEEKDDE